MFDRRASKALAAVVAASACVLGAVAFMQSANAGTGPGSSGNTITNAAQAQAPFSPGTFDSGQPIDVVVPPNSVLTPNATVFILECAAPNGVDPTTTASCDGNTSYAGGTISVNSDGSIDVISSSTNSGLPYIIYALPDQVTLGEGSQGAPKCGLGAANECVLYIGQGGGNDVGMSAPHFFSQAFQVHPDSTDSGTLNPGDGTFPADSAPAITSANATTFTQGSAGTFTVTTSGFPPPTLTESGALPSGVTFDPSTGILSGTPSGFGTYPLTFQASNGIGSPASQSFTLTVQPGISGDTIPGAAAAQSPFAAGTFDSGQPIDVVVPPNGVLTPGQKVEVLECSAPNGVDPTNISSCDGNTAYAGGTIRVNSDGSIDVINSSTDSGLPYVIYALPDQVTFGESSAGAPKCGQGSTNDCILYIGQGGGQDPGFSLPHFFSQPFQVHPDPTDSGTLNPGDGTFPADSAPAITSANSTTFTTGTAGSFTVTATGYGPPTFSETGALPAGVSLSTAGVLSGTPTQDGTYSITITANNGIGSPATQSFTLTVDSAPAITSANHTTFTQGSAGTFTVTATGSPTPTLAESGTLPTGVTFTASTGVLAGTPTQSGTFPITFTASNGVGSPATQSFTLTVNGSGTAPAITSANHATFTEGSAGTFTVTATGSPTPTLAETGALPTGVTFMASTGVLAGTPTQSGTFPITFTATNGVGSPASQSFLLIVDTKSGGVPTVTADGTVNCTTAAGKDAFSPALFATGNANSETSSVSVKLSSCTTTPNNLPAGSIITGKASWSTVTTTSNGSANACSSLGTSKAVVETIKWKDKNSSGVTLAKLNPTTLHVSGFDKLTNTGGSPGFDLPQDTGGTASGTGSFVGTNAGATSEANLFTVDTQTQINALCGSSTGVAKLKLGGVGTTADPSHFGVG